MAEEKAPSPAVAARQLMRRLDRATLATSQQGWPYASLVMVALDQDATPLLLLSDLAEHTKNLKGETRASLLFDGTGGRDDPLTGPRVTVLGEMAVTQDPRLMARFVARHPSAETYAGFADFRLYRLAVARGHFVAGFGRINGIEGPALLGPSAPALAAAEIDILTHMNKDHRDAINLYAMRLAGAEGEDWQLTGIDPEGADLRLGGQVARVNFAKPVGDAESARVELVRLAKMARRDG